MPQRSPENVLAAPPGFRQVPLVSADQLSVGQILTGPAWRSVMKVAQIDANNVHLAPVISAQPDGHVHTFTRTRPRVCACGYRITMIAALGDVPENAGLLPVRADALPKTFILVPLGELVSVDPFTLYVGRGGTVLSVAASGIWNVASTVPVIPLVAQLWTVPEELRRLLR